MSIWQKMLFYVLVAAVGVSTMYAILYRVDNSLLEKRIHALENPPPTPPRPAVWDGREELENMVAENFPVYPQYLSYVFDAVDSSAREFSVPQTLVLGVLDTESSFRFQDVSNKGCIGLMQINPKTWMSTLVDKGILKTQQELYDPKINIRAGAFVLRTCLDESNWNVEQALGRYFGAQDKTYISKVIRKVGLYSIEVFYQRRNKK